MTNPYLKQIYIQAHETDKKLEGMIKEIVTAQPQFNTFSYEEYNRRTPIWEHIKNNTLLMEESCNIMLEILKKQENPPRKMIQAEIALKKARVSLRKIVKMRGMNTECLEKVSAIIKEGGKIGNP